MRLKNKISVITGAGSGIGRAAALLFAREGAQVICVDMDERGGKDTIEMLRKEKHESLFIKADVSNSKEVQVMAGICQRNVKKVDILFNNAAYPLWQSFETTDEETWSRMMEVNLTSIFLCSKYLLPLLKLSGAASIINHGSIDAILGNPKIAAYSAAKGGMIPLTHVMAHELAKYNIRVNCMHTGGISTAIVASKLELLKKIIDLTPLNRAGTPDEGAYVALFFASDESSFVTGANLVIDGGRTGITQGCF